MSEQVQEHFEARAEEIGDSAYRARQSAAGTKGGSVIRAAVSLYKSMTTEQSQAQELRAMAQAAVPAILARWVQAAQGKLKGWPASAQLKAGENVVALAGHSLDVAPGTSDGRPMAELPLDELQTLLGSMLDNARTLAAVQGSSQRIDDVEEALPHKGMTPSDDGSSATAQAVSEHSPPPTTPAIEG